MNKRPITIKPGQGAEAISTKRLIRGLYVGFNFTFFEMDAVPELVKRGEAGALMEVYRTTTRKFAKVAIERALKLPKGGAK